MSKRLGPHRRTRKPVALIPVWRIPISDETRRQRRERRRKAA